MTACEAILHMILKGFVQEGVLLLLQHSSYRITLSKSVVKACCDEGYKSYAIITAKKLANRLCLRNRVLTTGSRQWLGCVR